MKYFPKNTLAYYLEAPQYHRNDLGLIPVGALAEATRKYAQSCGMVQPNYEAVSFYALNHLSSLIRKKFTLHEPLPEWANEVMSSYLTEVTGQGKRMLHYLIAICTREMRHLKVESVSPAVWTSFEKEFGINMLNFMKKVKDGGEEKLLQKFYTAPPEVNSKVYLEGLAKIFHQPQGPSKPWNGSYGGKAWGKIADTCASFITGKTSMEAMVDTGYTLAHNTSPIFNKGMMYEHYTSDLLMILDIQRSGQMPEAVLDNNLTIPKPIPLKKLVNTVRKEFPKEFRGYVDWFQVEKLGALGNYSNFKALQKKEHPEEEIISTPVIKMVGNKKALVVDTYTIWPGKAIPKLQREMA